MHVAMRSAHLLILLAATAATATSLLSEAQEAWLLAVAHGAQGGGLPFPPANATQLARMEANAAAHEQQLRQSNVRYGHVVDVLFNSTANASTAAAAVAYDTVGDSATWTGHLLAAEAMEAAAATSNASLQAALANVNSTLAVFELLTTCTKTKGYIARAAMPANDLAYAAYYATYKEGHGICEPPYDNLVWLDWSSRDVYSGTAFGLAAVLRFVQDAGVRARAAAIVERIVDNLLLNNWWIISPTGHGKVTNPAPFHILVWQRMGLTVNPAKYGSQYNYAETFAATSATSMTLHDVFFQEYYANNLMAIDMFVVTALETDASRLAVLASRWKAAAVSDGAQQMQASFSALYACVLPQYAKAEPIATGVFLGTLLDFPPAPKWSRLVNQETNPIYFPHHKTKDGREVSKFAMLVRDRVQGAYQWAWNPVDLLGGLDAPYLFASVDILLAHNAGHACGLL